MARPPLAAFMLLFATLGCASAQTPPSPKPNIDPGGLDRPSVIVHADTAAAAPVVEVSQSLDPAEAFRRGWMPLAETGVDLFLNAHPTYDGRGVLIAILDSGIDAGVPGLGSTSTGERKILDLRDFSGEGEIALAPATVQGDRVLVGGRRLSGFGRLAALGTGGKAFGGILRESVLGNAPAADVNGNGLADDSLAVVVVRASDGWVLFADTDGDGSLANERPVHDYLVGHETFGWSSRGRKSPLTVAVNLADGTAGGPPKLDLFFDTSAHGTHVSGIASGYSMYGVAGFNGVAPGAQLIGCKIANDAQGGISTTGSMIRALDYAIRFAAERRFPLVVNLSFGVGNEQEGAARIDAALDSVLALHPDVVFMASAGNDGPGLSSLGFPGSARRVITVGATLPAAFLSSTPSRPGPVAFFSSRGAELAKPDLVTPGMAYSTVPAWDAGGEQESGTSMASPHAAGLAALLLSASAAHRPDAAAIRQALMVTARPVSGNTVLDEGVGVPDVGRADRWLQGGHRLADVTISGPSGLAGSGAFQIVQRGSAADTVVSFTLRGAQGGVWRLRSSAAWARVPSRVTLAAGATALRVTYDAGAFRQPGVYTAVVTGWPADTLAGPAFRLVNTVVVAHPRGQDLSVRSELPPGAVKRVFFVADSGRPFDLRGTSPTDGATLYLHEPGGMPFRDGNGVSAGAGDSAAEYDVDAGDIVAGAYEAVMVASPLSGAGATIEVYQSPVSLHFVRDRDGLAATLTNFTDSTVSVRAAAVLAGARRTVTIATRGSDVQRIPFTIPAWARGAVIEISMDRAQWTRFTDFGVTLFDSAGHQLGKEPLNYALGRLQVPLPKGHGDMLAEVGLFPGFADSASAAAPWTARAAIVLYADSAVTLGAATGDPPVSLSLPAHGSGTARFTFAQPPWTLGDGFIPLGALVVEAGGRLWSRQAALPPAAPPVMR